MKRTNGDLVMPDIQSRIDNELILADGHGLIADGGRAEELVNKSVECINNVLQTSAAQLRTVAENFKETIKGCEAKIALHEKIQVIVKRDELIYSIERSAEVLKDK